MPEASAAVQVTTVSPTYAEEIQTAALVLPCAELDATLTFFTDTLGFRLDAIFPADEPSVAVISGYGLRVRLVRGSDAAPGLIRLGCRDPDALAHGASATIVPEILETLRRP